MDFNVLCNIAYHGEIPSSYAIRNIASCSRANVGEVSDALTRLRLMKFLSWCGMGGNDENRMFRFLFKELLPNEEMFDSSDILCISDFGWCELEDDVKEHISQAKSGGMKFYGLAVADHLWMGFGPEEAMNTMDSKWQWHGGECISLNEDKKEE